VRPQIELTACVLLVAAAPAFSCELLQAGEFRIHLYNNRPAVEASINGQRVQLMIDTGSFATLLTRPAAEALNLTITNLRGVSLYGVGGADAAGRVIVQDFTLGNFTTHRIKLIASSRHEFAPPIMGLVGGDLFTKYDLEFDLADGAVRLFQPKNCSGDQVVYWHQPYSAVPFAPSQQAPELGGEGTDLRAYVSLNGSRTLAEFDSGATVSIVTTAAAKRAGVTIESDGVTAGPTIHGMGGRPVEAYTAVFPAFSVGDESISNARLRVADLFAADKVIKIGSRIPIDAVAAPGMLLGTDFFLSHRIYFARSQGQIYFSYRGGPVFAPRPRSQRPPVDSIPAQAPPPGAAAEIRGAP
jgi:predicted aspartyl protease